MRTIAVLARVMRCNGGVQILPDALQTTGAVTDRDSRPREHSVNSPGSERRAAELLHDLRNPVAAVRMVVTFVVEMPDEVPLSQVKDHLELACSATDRAFELIGAVERELSSPDDAIG